MYHHNNVYHIRNIQKSYAPVGSLCVKSWISFSLAYCTNKGGITQHDTRLTWSIIGFTWNRKPKILCTIDYYTRFRLQRVRLLWSLTNNFVPQKITILIDINVSKVQIQRVSLTTSAYLWIKLDLSSNNLLHQVTNHWQ